MKRVSSLALASMFAMTWVPAAMAQDTGGDPAAAPYEDEPAEAPEPGPPMADDELDPAPMEPMGREDRARFRWGIALQSGPLLMPVITATSSSNGSASVKEETLILSQIGVNAELGIQIDDLIGVYVKPSIDVMFGDVIGIHVSAAVMADFTLLDGLISAGAGFDFGRFIGFGGSIVQVSVMAGNMYGGRLHFAIHPYVGEDAPTGPGRKAFSIGVDLRLLGGSVAKASSGVEGAKASAGTDFFFAPMVTIGYTDF